ncbi:hypothetical protein ACR720_10425 [Sphingomonas parapaucimobilis]|uniref:hypothetical protein n=1 Tax=Sphingomonas parapaucimobilis TaxID=28213 RepID=UPI0039E7F830
MKRFCKSMNAMLTMSGLTLLSATACSAQPAAVTGKTPCAIARPTITRAAPARWLGACSQGRAEGIGVLRIGTGEPYEFFLGEVRAGRPVRGLIKTINGWYPIARFDAHMTAVNPRSWEPRQAHDLYVLAVKSADATGRRFATAGNLGSARYYQRLARQIAEGEPE